MPRPQSKTRAVHALVPLLAALVLAACAVPPASAPRLAATVPAAFQQTEGRWAAQQPAEAQPRGPWWQAFADPLLDDLITRADSGNTRVQLAAARLAQARALLRASQANRLPQLGLAAAAQRGSTSPASGSSAPGSLFDAGVGLRYEADLFGRLAGADAAAALEAGAQQALVQSTRLLVQAEVAQAYFGLRALDEERALVRQTVVAYGDSLRLTRSRHAAGDVAELDLVRLQAEVAATEAQALALDRRRAQLEHALALLLGETPGALKLAAADWRGALPQVPPGLPSTMLARRPDVAAAQQAMQAAQTRAGVARSVWFPDLALTASGGLASTELGDLFRWSARAWGVGALLSLPLFDGGRRAAGLDRAEAVWDEAAVRYREDVLLAFREVEDQLAALRLLADEADAQARAVDAASRATRLSASRYRNGYVSQLELLDAQRGELSRRREALQLRAARYQATVGLIRALGGGWGEGVAATGQAEQPPRPG